MTKIYPSPLVLVEEFHLTYGHKIRVTPAFGIKEEQLRYELIKEEVEELEEAVENVDFIEVIDALADIIYVVYGAALAHGLNVERELNDSQDYISPAVVIQKMLSFEKEISTTPVYNKEALEKFVPEIRAGFNLYATSIATKNTKEATSGLVKIIVNCYSLSWLLGVNLDAVLEEVQSSNMSKLGEDGLPILREDGKILKGPNFFVPNIQRVLEEQGYVN